MFRLPLKAAGHNISHSDQTVMMRSIPRPSCSNRGKAYRDSKVTSPNGAYLENAQLCQDWGTLPKKMGGRGVLNGFDTVDSSEILLSPPGMYKHAVSEGTHIFGVQI